MADTELATGDTCYLKSGSPELTISDIFERIDTVKMARVSWWHGDALKSETFPLVCLTKEFQPR